MEIQLALIQGFKLTGSKVENKLFIVNFYYCEQKNNKDEINIIIQYIGLT